MGDLHPTELFELGPLRFDSLEIRFDQLATLTKPIAPAMLRIQGAI